MAGYPRRRGRAWVPLTLQMVLSQHTVLFFFFLAQSSVLNIKGRPNEKAYLINILTKTKCDLEIES